MKFKFFESRFYISNIVIAILLLVFFFYTHSAFADTVELYTRTPSDVEIVESTTINIQTKISDIAVVSSYKIAFFDGTNTVFSSCINTPSPYDTLIDANVDFTSVPVADYTDVYVRPYEDPDCSTPASTISLETGSPAFSVVVVPLSTQKVLGIIFLSLLIGIVAPFVFSKFYKIWTKL